MGDNQRLSRQWKKTAFLEACHAKNQVVVVCSMSSLPRTYNINVAKLLSLAHVNTTYVWYHHFLSRDPRWEFRDGCRVTISDEKTCSLVQGLPPHSDLLNDKRHFTRICRGESWTLPALVLQIDHEEGRLDEPSRGRLEAYLLREDLPSLLFLKKAGGVGGGYDVHPLIIAREQLPLIPCQD